MSQKRLKALSLMAIESDLTNALEFHDIVEDFARNRARKMHFIGEMHYCQLMQGTVRIELLQVIFICG